MYQELQLLRHDVDSLQAALVNANESLYTSMELLRQDVDGVEIAMQTGMEASIQTMDSGLWNLMMFLDDRIGHLHDTTEMIFFVVITCLIFFLIAKILDFIWRHMIHIWF